MRAVVWKGRRDVGVETVPDPTICEPTDAIIRVTSSGLCRSDLHLYEVMAPFMTAGDILGHEPMGIVEAVAPGSRTWPSVIEWSSRSTSRAGPARCASTASSRSARRRRCANTAAGRRCSATPSCTARSQALRPNCCASPTPTTAPSRSPTARPTTGSCSCPMSYQLPGKRSSMPESTPAVHSWCSVSARSVKWPAASPRHRTGHRHRPRRRAARRLRLDLTAFDNDADLIAEVRQMTDGRGPDAVIDAVGMEAHGYRELLTSLPLRQRQILVMRFFEGRTQTEIGQALGIGQVHVSRLIRAALDTLAIVPVPPERRRRPADVRTVTAASTSRSFGSVSC